MGWSIKTDVDVRINSITVLTVNCDLDSIFSQAQITNIPSTITKVWNRGVGYVQDALKRDEDR